MRDEEGHEMRAESVSMVTQTATALTRMSLAAEDGNYLGAEADLLQALGISRPTLRQAAKVVENDRLLTVRRGAGGGFYAARPTARDALQAPAMWLKLQAASLEQMNAASRLIFPQAAFMAASCDDPSLIEELRQFRHNLDVRRPGDEAANETVAAEVSLHDLIARMTGDPVMQLFIGISYSFGLLDRRLNLYRGEIARRLLWLELQRRMCDAILARDGELARKVSYERGEMVNLWIQAGKEGDPAAVRRPARVA
jgi:GntR family transcriptional repressor for pyruvate dehydrogenase complex